MNKRPTTADMDAELKRVAAKHTADFIRLINLIKHRDIALRVNESKKEQDNE
jgi:hypothetical protein